MARRSVSFVGVVGLAAAGVVVVVSAGSALAVADPVGAATSGLAYGFGYNNAGQLGNGTTVNATTPTAAALPAGVAIAQVADGAVHTVALAADGKVYAWGDNTYGELGNGSTTASGVPVAVSVPAGVTVTAVSAGYYDSFALTSTGKVYAWGLGNVGQLGNGTTTSATKPALVNLPAGVSVTAVSAGYAQVLALTSTGSAYGWGYNNAGQIGDGTVATRLTPVAVKIPAGTTVASVSAGYAHSLAVTTTGAVLGWGSNGYGQVGNGGTTNVVLPTAINVAGVSVSSVSAGGLQSFAVTSGGSLLAWGDNTYGELGRGNTTSSSTPTPVALPSGVTLSGASAGYDYSLFRTSTGQVLGTGDNRQGSLGTGTTTAFYVAPIPAALPAGAPAVQVAASVTGLHSFVVIARVATTTTLSSSSNPVSAGLAVTFTATITPTDGGGTVSFTTGSDATAIPGCSALPLVRSSGSTYQASCSSSSLPVGSNVIGAAYSGDGLAIASSGALDGGQTVTAVDGVATGWGLNNYGQLGNGTTTASAVPTIAGLPAGTTVTQLTGDAFHGVAITSTGAVYAWGDNTYGELGNGTTTSSKTPVPVTLPDGVTALAVSAGQADTLLLTSSGSVYGWGVNNYGQLGDGTTTNRLAPTLVALPSGVVATSVSAGFGHSAALTSTGAIYTWGLNNYGQLGTGTTTTSLSPAVVALPSGASAIGVSAGYAHTLAVTTAGKVYAWGDNAGGELGTGTFVSAKSPVAALVPTGTSVASVSAGYFDSAATTTTGGVLTWGYNNYGELGNGTTTTSNQPAAITLPDGANVTAVRAGEAATYALDASGRLYAWGDNTYGELGVGSTTASTVPVAVHLPTGGKATAIGGGPYGFGAEAIVARAASTVSVTSAPNPSNYGQSVTIAATVAPTDGGGTVAFTADGASVALAGCASVPLVATIGGYTATCTVSSLEPGSHSITAAYSGDGFYLPATGSLAGGQQVLRLATSTSVVTSANPATYASPVTFTATVTGSDGGGTVAFAADGTAINGCTAQPLGSGATATCTTSALSAGSHVITAGYSGDDHYAPSSGTLAAAQVVKYATTLTVAPVHLLHLLNPPFQATLTNTADGTPVAGARVDFEFNLTKQRVQCTAVTNSSGVASCSPGLLNGLGTYQANYAGDDTHLPSTASAALLP